MNSTQGLDSNISIGDEVGWTWGSGIAVGTVTKISPEKTTIESKGKHIVRNGTPDDPALTIKHSSGNSVLKLVHEVQIVKKR